MRLLRVFFSTQPPKVIDGTIIAEADIYSPIHVPYCLPQDTSKERTGARTQPCLTPLEMEKGSDCSPLERTCPVISTWKKRMI